MRLPVQRRQQRSIPACAGEPAEGNPGSQVEQVYPRVCGGTALVVRRGALLSGLSPRVRGNQGAMTVHSHSIWSIPACAGEPVPTPHVRSL